MVRLIKNIWPLEIVKENIEVSKETQVNMEWFRYVINS